MNESTREIYTELIAPENFRVSELDLYDYPLPEELIARTPPPHREDARLLVLHRKDGRIEHTSIRSLPDYLQSGDCLVFNDTRVVPARLYGHREATGGKWEGLFVKALDETHWKLIGQTRGKLNPGETILVEAKTSSGQMPLRLKLLAKDEQGEWTVELPSSTSGGIDLLQQYGEVPLPHYIERDTPTSEDIERYQTVYAQNPGAVAAPTAGLHFTPELISECESRGVQTARVTLHVGIGTFRPINVDRLDDHQMHSEWCHLPQATADQISEVRQRRGRVVAVGTTSTRTLEAVAAQGELCGWEGETELFIRPPYEFKVVDVLLTNFHLPKSTLLVLLSTFAGRELVLHAYAEAIRERYRFFSYGDAMLVL